MSNEYLCSQCSYKTNQKDSLKRHTKAIHAVPISKTELSRNKQGEQTRKEISISPHPDKKSGSGNDRKNLVDNHITNPGTGIEKSSTKELQTNTSELNNTYLQKPKEANTQRPKKSELYGWQLSTRKNFPDEVRKSFLRQKKHVNCFRDIKSMHKFFL